MADAAAAVPVVPTAAVPETPTAGLSSAEVAERRARGLANAGGERTSRSVAEILRANILTRFNFILGALLAVDGVVRASTGLQADESLLTGESEPVDKRPGD